MTDWTPHEYAQALRESMRWFPYAKIPPHMMFAAADCLDELEAELARLRAEDSTWAKTVEDMMRERDRLKGQYQSCCDDREQLGAELARLQECVEHQKTDKDVLRIKWEHAEAEIARLRQNEKTQRELLAFTAAQCEEAREAARCIWGLMTLNLEEDDKPGYAERWPWLEEE